MATACLPPFSGQQVTRSQLVALRFCRRPCRKSLYPARGAGVPSVRAEAPAEFHVAAKRSYFHVHRGSTDALAWSASRNGDQNMALREIRPTEHDQAVEELDREIREFVRHAVVTNSGQQPENESELVASNINSLLQRVTAASLQEIDSLITELESSRDMLQSEAARVQRAIVQYSTLSQTALQSTKIITESLTQLKKVPDEQIRSAG
jgi:hypothetical protein